MKNNINAYELYKRIENSEMFECCYGKILNFEIYYGIVEENGKFYVVYCENNTGVCYLVNENGANTEAEAIEELNKFKNKIYKMVEIENTL